MKRGMCISRSLVGEKIDILGIDVNSVLVCLKIKLNLSNIFFYQRY